MIRRCLVKFELGEFSSLSESDELNGIWLVELFEIRITSSIDKEAFRGIGDIGLIGDVGYWIGTVIVLERDIGYNLSSSNISAYNIIKYIRKL